MADLALLLWLSKNPGAEYTMLSMEGVPATSCRETDPPGVLVKKVTYARSVPLL